MSEIWQEIAARKQRERADRIPSQWKLSPSHIPHESRTNLLSVPRGCGLLSEQELDVTDNYDAFALVAALSSGKLKAVDVTTAFCKRAAIAHQLTNCLTEIFFDDAITRAKQLDDEMNKSGSPIGPLHGLPISLKDTFKVKGYDASIGAAALCFKPADTNSALVDLLLQQGAVLYCKTNIPLTLAALDSHNNVFGRTLNPANTALTAGGSSGGEGALIAMRGSPLGIGTDVGGSIRIPAMCNGLVGVKPSHGRVPYAGQEAGSLAGSSKLGIEATAGPIARTVRDCELLLRVVGDASPWLFDPDVLPHPWTQQLPLLPPPSSRPTKPLRIGIMRTDGHTLPLPPIANLMEEISHHLRHPALPFWHP
ncbi:amidase, partial [Hortaea werneckii]